MGRRTPCYREDSSCTCTWPIRFVGEPGCAQCGTPFESSELVSRDAVLVHVSGVYRDRQVVTHTCAVCRVHVLPNSITGQPCSAFPEHRTDVVLVHATAEGVFVFTRQKLYSIHFMELVESNGNGRDEHRFAMAFVVSQCRWRQCGTVTPSPTLPPPSSRPLWEHRSRAQLFRMRPSASSTRLSRTSSRSVAPVF